MDLVFQGYQRAIRFRVSRDRGFPLNGRGFLEVCCLQNPRVSGINRSKDPLRGHGLKGFDIFKIQRFQGLRDEGFQGFKVQGLKGERAPKIS